jgi:hypothetical protein
LGKNISTSRLAELVQAHTRDPPPPLFSRMRHTRATWPDRARLSLPPETFLGFFTFWTDRCTIFILPFYFILFFPSQRWVHPVYRGLTIAFNRNEHRTLHKCL